jgi:hypothetical protein
LLLLSVHLLLALLLLSLSLLISRLHLLLSCSGSINIHLLTLLNLWHPLNRDHRILSRIYMGRILLLQSAQLDR